MKYIPIELVNIFPKGDELPDMAHVRIYAQYKRVYYFITYLKESQNPAQWYTTAANKHAAIRS